MLEYLLTYHRYKYSYNFKFSKAFITYGIWVCTSLYQIFPLIFFLVLRVIILSNYMSATSNDLEFSLVIELASPSALGFRSSQ